MKRFTLFVCVAVVGFVCSTANAQFGGRGGDQLDEFEKRLQKLNEKVEMIERWMIELKKSPLADPDNAKVTVFQLEYRPSESVAKIVRALLGEQGYRMAVDDKANLLVVSSSEAVTNEIKSLIADLDQTPNQKNQESDPHSTTKAPASRSLLIHTFWLADGLSDDNLRDPIGFLPESVIEAAQKVGVVNPRIVLQSTASVIAEVDAPRSYQSEMLAALGNQELKFATDGELILHQQQQVELHSQLRISVHNPRNWRGKENAVVNVSELSSSTTAPLGHYMVLGTANYVSESEPLTQKEHREQMELAERNKRTGGEVPMLPKPKLTTSRFAFVIQVVEGGSYSPEK